MMPAAKHGDPQMGVDIHLCVVPPSPSPVPLPTPHMSIVFDPFDYVPYIGATVTVCGMKRAVAGTEGKVVHIPPGFPFAPKIPDTSDEIFMGSATVDADGDPFSFLGVMVLGCQVAGMPSPPRPKGRGKKLMLLPTTVNVAIPTTVFIGGPPTISLMGMASKLGFAALGKFAKSKLFAAMRRKVFGHMKPGFLKCVVLRAEPVDVTNGEVVLEQEDTELRSRVPLRWIRAYASGNLRVGACGPGWETPADIRLEVYADGTAAMFRPAMPAAPFLATPVPGGGPVLELWDGARWSDTGAAWQVRTKDGLTYHFPKAGHAGPGGPMGSVMEHLLSGITDASGNALRFRRRGRELAAIIEDAGRSLEVAWHEGRIVRVSLHVPDAGDGAVQAEYAYSRDGELLETRDALGHPYRYAWDRGRLVRHTNRVGLSFHYAYELVGGTWRVVHTWGDGGLYDYRFGWADEAGEVRITNSLGHVSVLTLDEQRLPIRELDALGGVTTYEYDAVGRASAVVDQDGLRTEYAYDERGNLLRVTRPDGAASVAAFDAQDCPVAVTAEDGACWARRWDDRGLLLGSTSPLGHTTLYEHDGRGQMVAFVTPRGGRWAFGYDAYGNLAWVRDPLGHVTAFAYDGYGRIVSRTDPLGRVATLSYDAAGQLVALRRPSGAERRFAYDPEGDLQRERDELGHETRYTLHGQGLVSAVLLPDGATLRFCYDTEEQLTGIVNARGEEHTLVRDALGRIVEEVDYWGQATRYALTPGGRLTRRTDPLNQVTEYETDALGQVTSRSLPHPGIPGGTLAERYGYDPTGNIVAAENPWVTVARVFDGDGRMVEEAAGGAVVTYGHDEAGNCVRRSATLPDGTEHVAEYRYDLRDQVSAIITGGLHATLSRNAASAVVAEQLGPALRRELAYDSDDNLIWQAVSASGGTVAALRYKYDDAARLLARHDATLGTDRFTYGQNGRVVQHDGPAGAVQGYAYDPAGDMLAPVARGGPVFASGAGALRAARHNGDAYQFDRTGALVRRDGARGALALRWDAVGRLVSSDHGGAPATYEYDALGRRFAKASGGQRVRFWWDADMIGGEWVEGVPGSRAYVAYPGTFVPFACLDEGRTTRIGLYQTDPNGAPTHVLAPDGAVLWRGRYDPLGQFEGGPEGVDGSDALGAEGMDNPIRLQGQYFDAETGLHYNRHRYFDPGLGAFVSLDPLSFTAGPAPYQLGPSTLTWVDPLGLKKCRIQKGVVAALAQVDTSHMANPHMHHIVMEGALTGWKKENRRFVTEARTLLKKHKVSLQGKHNVVMAENLGHSVEYAKEVHRRLMQAAGGKDPAKNIKAALDRIGDDLFNNIPIV